VHIRTEHMARPVDRAIQNLEIAPRQQTRARPGIF
jgi:hypothetical protein